MCEKAGPLMVRHVIDGHEVLLPADAVLAPKSTGNHHTIFIDECPRCGGDGGCESSPTNVDHVTGEPITHWVKCATCDGTGEVETEHECRTLEDLENEATETPQ